MFQFKQPGVCVAYNGEVTLATRYCHLWAKLDYLNAYCVASNEAMGHVDPWWKFWK